MYKTRRTS